MRIELGDQRAWSVEVGHAGIEVRILEGEAWITREGDPEDHVLEAPAVFRSSQTGRLAVMALGFALLAVGRPARHTVNEPAHAAA